ncbi:MAG: (Na+)-NQR maturation NqrM [Pseudomonadota bacterium]
MTWLVVFLTMLLVVLGMSVGVLMGRKPIAGSCGGIAALGIEKQCSICGGNPSKCEAQQQAADAGGEDVVQTTLAYDATKR